MTSLVSVIIPTYNRAALVCEAIDSVLAQTYPHNEIIVVDDGSTDGTAEALRARYGERIRYFWQENSGVSAARNRGFRESRGEYVLFLDSDDLLLPNALQTLMAALGADRQLAAAFGDGQFVGPDGAVLGLVSERHVAGLAPTFSDAVLDIPAALQSFLFRRATLLALIGPFDEQMWGYEDWDIVMRVAALGPLRGTRDVVFQYRFLGGNKSSPASPAFERRRQSFIHNRRKILESPRFCSLAVRVREQFFHRLFLSTMLLDDSGQKEFLSHPHFLALPATQRAGILYDLAVERMAGAAPWAGSWRRLISALRLRPLDARLYSMLLLDLWPPLLRRGAIRLWRRVRSGPPREDPIMALLNRGGGA